MEELRKQTRVVETTQKLVTGSCYPLGWRDDRKRWGHHAVANGSSDLVKTGATGLCGATGALEETSPVGGHP